MISSSSSNVLVVLPISMFMILFPFSSHGRCLAQVLVSRSHKAYCVPFALGLLCPRLFWSAFLSRWIFLLYLVFSIFMVYCIVVRVLFESYPIKLLKKINRRGVPPLSRAHLGQLNIVWSQDKLSHRKLQGRYPITRFQLLQTSQHYIDRRNQQIMQMCSQFSEHSTCTQSDEYSRCCLMKIGYLLDLRKIGMVVMISSSTFQSTTICC